jgi:AsmA protein
MNAYRRSPRLFRLPVLAGGAIVVLGVSGFIVLASTLSPNRLREDLQQAVERATGRTLTISGGVHLRLGLAPHVEVDDVALSNIEGGSRPQMMTARSVSAELALLPLLSGDAVISGLTIVSPDILLERIADNSPNWVFSHGVRAVASRNAEGGEAGGGGGGPHRVQIQTITLQGGQVTWQPVQGTPVSIAIDTLVVSAQSFDSPMSLSFRGSEAGVPITLTASTGSLERLEGGAVSALAGAWPLTVDLAGAGATLHLLGGINHPEQGRSYQFRLTGHADNLGTLNTLLPQPLFPPAAEINATALLSDGSQGEMQTSQVSIHAGASDLTQWVPGLTLKQGVLSAPGPGQVAQLDIDGMYQQQPLRIAATVMQPDMIGAGTPLQVTLTGQAAAATLSAHGTLPPGLNAAGLDMTVNFHAPDLAALSPLVGHSLPPAQGVNLNAELVDAGVKLRGIAVQNLAVSSSFGDISGNVTADWSPRTSLTGTLASRALDLDGITAALPLPRFAPEPQADAIPQPTAPARVEATLARPNFSPRIPLAWLRNTDADLALSAGDLTFAGQHYHDLDAHLTLDAGKLALNPFRAMAPEGAIIGGVSIDASTDQPPVALSLRSPSISAGAVARVLGFPDGASGTMQVDAQVSGVGETLAAVQASLEGHVGLAMVNGQVQDALIEGLIGDALHMAGLSTFGGGTSQVRCFALRTDFSAGIGHIRAMALDASRLSLDGTGQIDLRDDTADLHLTPRVQIGPTDVAAPVQLAGPFGHMKAELDPVLGGGRVGLSIGGGGPAPSHCQSDLSLARNGLGGPLPAAMPAPQPGFKIRKPKDLLKGLFH